MPTACAAMPMRPASSVWKAMRRPAPLTPRRSAGVSSKLRSAVEEEFRPIFSSSRVTLKPSAPRRTTKADARSGARAKGGGGEGGGGGGGGGGGPLAAGGRGGGGGGGGGGKSDSARVRMAPAS